jgi:hypothetical protein
MYTMEPNENKKIPSNFEMKVIEFAQVNIPVFSEVASRGRDWIDYGADNFYPTYLSNLKHSSAKHGAILNTKAQMTAGEGFITEANQVLIDFLANKSGEEKINKIVKKVAVDLNIYGGFSLNVIWSKDREKIAQIEYLDFSKVRLAKKEKITDKTTTADELRIKELDYYYVSPDWANYRRPENTPKKYQGFSAVYNKDEASQIYYTIIEEAGVDFYTLPDYIGAQKWINLDALIADFHLSSVENGFHPGLIINFATGIPTEEEMDDIYQKLQAKYAGSSNANKIILTWSNGAEQAPTITPISLNDTDERFKAITEVVDNNIFAGHGVTSPMLFGIREAGQLGGRNELREAYMIYLGREIRPKQIVIEDAFTQFTTINGYPKSLKIQNLKIYEDGQ